MRNILKSLESVLVDGTVERTSLLAGRSIVLEDLNDPLSVMRLVSGGEDDDDDGTDDVQAARRAAESLFRFFEEQKVASLDDRRFALLLRFCTLYRTEVRRISEFYEHKEAGCLRRAATLTEQSAHWRSLHEGGGRTSDKELRATGKVLEHAYISLYQHVKHVLHFGEMNGWGFEVLAGKAALATGSDAEFPLLAFSRQQEYSQRRTLLQLMEKLEHDYRELFAGGSDALALGRLNAPKRDEWSWSTASTFFFLGACVPAVLFVLTLLPRKHRYPGLDEMTVWPVFRLIGVPIVGLWMWGVNLLVWHRTKLNHTYVFRFRPESALGHLAVFRVAAVLSLLWLLFFGFYTGCINGAMRYPSWFPPDVLPVVLLLLVLGFLGFPFDTMHRRSRFLLLQAVAYTVISPFGRIHFVDYYIGDVLTSLVTTLKDFEYTACLYLGGGWMGLTFCARYPDRYLPPVISFLPQYWRAWQCIRRFLKERKVEHIFNTLKYLLAFSVILFSSLHGNLEDGEHRWSALRYGWIAAFVVSTLYMYVWDVTMDWGFVRWSSPNFPLRTHLFYYRPFYYWCVVSNLVMRFFWTITLGGLPFYVPGISKELISTVAAVVEICRRFQWSILRVENEYVGTKSEDPLRFRQTESVPLPFRPDDLNPTRRLRTPAPSASKPDGGGDVESGLSSKSFSSPAAAFSSTSFRPLPAALSPSSMRISINEGGGADGTELMPSVGGVASSSSHSNSSPSSMLSFERRTGSHSRRGATTTSSPRAKYSDKFYD